MKSFIEKILFGIIGVLVAITLFIVLCAATPGLSQEVGSVVTPLVQSLNPPKAEEAESAPVEAAAAETSVNTGAATAETSVDTSATSAQSTALTEDTTSIKLEETLNDNEVEVKKADE